MKRKEEEKEEGESRAGQECRTVETKTKRKIPDTDVGEYKDGGNMRGKGAGPRFSNDGVIKRM